MRLFIVAILFAPLLTWGQFFENISSENGLDFSVGTPNLGSGVSFFDYDRDGWNDLTFAVESDSLRLFKNVEGQLVQQPSPMFCDAEAKQINWVDFDNDGDYDLFVTQYFGNTSLLENTVNGFVNISQIAGIPMFLDAPTFGASWADYDKDGFLDVYICNYDGELVHENWLLHNNGDGTFEEVGVTAGVSNGFAATFQSCWIDYNSDGWPDLFVINDKAVANALYRNNTNGTFTDVSEATGTDIVMDAMSTTVADYDNDGALDIYITDEPPHNALLRNGVAQFVDVAADVGVEVGGISWGAVFIDYDNDLDDDLYVCTTSFPLSFKNVFFANTGSVFVDATWLGLDDEEHLSYGAAKGDFNNDGINDLVVSNANNNPQDLYLSPANENHSITVALEGTVSNMDGIGTWINSWVGGQKYVEWTMNGENYLSQESQYEIIPLGEFETLDSLQLIWPSGIEEMYYDIADGSFVQLIEGYLPDLDLEVIGGAICEGNSVTLAATDGFDSYLWSNGDSLQTIETSEPGSYWVQGFYNGGLHVVSDLLVLDSTTAATLTIASTNPSCHGLADGTISVSSDLGISSIAWSPESSDSSLTNLSSGLYEFNLIDTLGCSHQGAVDLIAPDSLWANAIVSNVSCFGMQDGTAVLETTGGSGEVNWLWGDLDPNALIADIYVIEGSDENGCAVHVEFEISQPDELELSLELVHSTGNDGSATATVSGGTEPHTLEWDGNEGDLSFEDLEPGSYTVIVTDSNECMVELDFVIDLVDIIESLEVDSRIYPNPASSVLTLELNGYEGNLEYSIFTSSGQFVRHNVLNNNFRIDVKDLPVGNYVIWIQFESRSTSHQFTIDR